MPPTLTPAAWRRLFASPGVGGVPVKIHPDGLDRHGARSAARRGGRSNKGWNKRTAVGATGAHVLYAGEDGRTCRADPRHVRVWASLLSAAQRVAVAAAIAAAPPHTPKGHTQ